MKPLYQFYCIIGVVAFFATLIAMIIHVVGVTGLFIGLCVLFIFILLLNT